MRENRQFVVQGIFIAVGIVFLIKLFFLQVVDDSYKSAADSNVIQKVIQYPHRGQIYDRKGKLVVMNGPVYDIMMIAKKAKIEDTLAFCSVMGFTKTQFDSLIRAARSSYSFSSVKPYPILKQVSNRDFAKIQDHLINYPGFYAVARTIRAYPHQSFSNALGYIGEVSKTFLEKQEEPYYKQGDYMGLSGLESYYEEYLRGKRGVKYTLVNVRGVEKGSFKDGKYDTTAVAGESMVSTIDLELQQYAELLMTNKVGSVVALEPSTGEILSMVSSPSYNPSLLTGRDFPVNFVPLQRDPLIPLYNRAIQAVYRPGSIFKLVQSLVAMQEGAITPSTTFPCGNAPVKCHRHASGHNDLHNAIRYSCNPYFYNVFRREILLHETNNMYKDSEEGLLRWRKHVASFGFGRQTGVDLPNEKRGLLPDTAIFNRKYGKGRWKFSNLYSMSIGEGELGVVPIQMANLAAIIANRGYYYTPHLIKSIGNSGKPLPQFQERHYTTIDSSHFQVVINGMLDAVRGGTVNWMAKLDSVDICGKTGTSQNANGKDHSVFVCFAPKDNPKIALAVYVENAGFGGSVAAPIATLLIEKYLKGTVKRKQLEKLMIEKSFMPEPKKPVLIAKKETSTTTSTTGAKTAPTTAAPANAPSTAVKTKNEKETPKEGDGRPAQPALPTLQVKQTQEN